MPLFRFPQGILFFVHIPKTGGTSVEAALGRACKAALLSPKRLDWNRCTPQHAHAAIYEEYGLTELADYAFTIVRDPFARAISEYKYQLRLWPDSEPKMPFAEWFLDTARRAQKDRYYLDNHIRRQTEFLSPEVDVYRFEQGIQFIIRSISDKFALDIQDDCTHEKKGGADPVTVTVSSLQLVAKYYASDFAALGYDQSIDRFLADAAGTVVLGKDGARATKSWYWRAKRKRRVLRSMKRAASS